MARKLASIQIIERLDPIEGADRIEVATVLGWKVVVQKGLYEVGDKAVYFEIDSVLPLQHFPELEKCKGRIKTIKLRGQISQGYLVPLEIVQRVVDCSGVGYHLATMEVGSELTECLGVTKYEPAPQGGNNFDSGPSDGLFPTYLISKTDESRIQSNPNLVQLMQGRSYYITCKMDGTSGTFGWDDEFFVASRNYKRKKSGNVYWQAAEKYGLPALFDNPEFRCYIFQGEVCGPGIQKNLLGLSEIDLFIFNIYSVVTKRYLDYFQMSNLCNYLCLTPVPLVEIGNSFNYSQEDLLYKAEGTYTGTKNEREGIVIRSHDGFENAAGGMLSMKAISNRYLLKGGN